LPPLQQGDEHFFAVRALVHPRYDLEAQHLLIPGDRFLKVRNAESEMMRRYFETRAAVLRGKVQRSKRGEYC